MKILSIGEDMVDNKFRISKLNGIERTIANLCNQNNDDWIKGDVEVSLFNKTKSSINHEKNTFVFNNVTYNANGSVFIDAEKELKKRLDASNVNPQDAIRDYRPNYVRSEFSTPHKEPVMDTQRMHEYWNNSKIYPKYNLSPNFYTHLQDTCKQMNCIIPEKDFNPEKFASREEQTVYEMSAIFAREAEMNSKTVKTVKNTSYYGLWQASSDATTTIREELAREEKPSLKNITPKGMLSITPEKQLDYLNVYIKACKRRFSKIPEGEPISPAQVWAMIQYPFKGKDQKKIETKQGLIDAKLERL